MLYRPGYNTQSTSFILFSGGVALKIPPSLKHVFGKPPFRIASGRGACNVSIQGLWQITPKSLVEFHRPLLSRLHSSKTGLPKVPHRATSVMQLLGDERAILGYVQLLNLEGSHRRKKNPVV